MAASQPTIVATSIGFDSDGPDQFDLRAGPAYLHAARLANAGQHPRICLIGTAVGDNPFWYSVIQQAFSKLDMLVTELRLFLVYFGTELHEAITEKPGALCYEIHRDGDRAVETALPTREL